MYHVWGGANVSCRLSFQSCTSDAYGVLEDDLLPCASRWPWEGSRPRRRNWESATPSRCPLRLSCLSRERTTAATRAWWLRAAAPHSLRRSALPPLRCQVSWATRGSQCGWAWGEKKGGGYRSSLRTVLSHTHIQSLEDFLKGFFLWRSVFGCLTKETTIILELEVQQPYFSVG